MRVRVAVAMAIAIGTAGQRPNVVFSCGIGSVLVSLIWEQCINTYHHNMLVRFPVCPILCLVVQ